jgi:hypothetical protein
MAEFTKFEQYLALADQLTAAASKEDLIETARLLAMNVAHYQSKFGDLPLEETLDIMGATEPTQEHLDLMASGLETFVGLLGNMMQGFDPKSSH